MGIVAERLEIYRILGDNKASSLTEGTEIHRMVEEMGMLTEITGIYRSVRAEKARERLGNSQKNG